MVCAPVWRDKQTMLYMISKVDLAHYRVSRAKDWAYVDCGTNLL